MVLALSRGLVTQAQFLPATYNSSNGAGGIETLGVVGVVKINGDNITLYDNIFGQNEIPIGTGQGEAIAGSIVVSAGGGASSGGGDTGGGDTGGGTGGTTGTLDYDFQSLTALPAEWTAVGTTAAVAANGLTVTVDGANGWNYNAESNTIPISDGLQIQYIFRSSFAFGAAGLIAGNGTWGSFARSDAFMVTSANQTGEFHNGSNKVADVTLGVAPLFNRVTVTFGATTAQIKIEYETSSGTFATGYDQAQPIPAQMAAEGIKFVLSPFGGNMLLRNITQGAGAGPGGGTGGGGGTITGNELDFDFQALTTFPTTWTEGPGTNTVAGNGLTVEVNGASGWTYNTESFPVAIESGVEIEYIFRSSFAFGAVGLIAASGVWGSFNGQNALILTTSNSTGQLHNGGVPISDVTLAVAPLFNRVTVTFGAATARVLIESETSSGTFESRYDEFVAIPSAMTSEGAKFVVSPFSGNMLLRSIDQRTVTVDPAAGQPGAVTSRVIPDGMFGYNHEALNFDDYNALDMSAGSVLAQTFELIGCNTLRLPGGDTSNFWEETGLYQDTEQTIPLSPNHFHGRSLPVWLAFQTNELTGTRANFKQLFDATGGSTFVYVLNVTTSTPAKEIAKVQDLIALGFPIKDLELGNEIFFGVPYYTGDGDPNSPKYLRGHTSATAYMVDMRDNFVPAIRTAFGNSVTIGIPVIPRSSNTGSRENEWSQAALDTGLDQVIDFYALHPYYRESDIGMTKADVGNLARADVLGKAAYSAQAEVLARASITILGPTADIKVTEFNSLTGTEVIWGQTWLHSLSQCMNMALMIRDERITMMIVHSLTGNVQWGGMVNPDGGNMDPTTRGIEDQPFTNGLSVPYSATYSGFAMGIIQRYVLGAGGNATLLADEIGFMVWRNVQTSRDAIFAVNNTGDTKNFDAPTGKTWAAKRWTNTPWASALAIPADVPAAIATAVGAGQNVTVPAFSLMVLEGAGSTPIADIDGSGAGGGGGTTAYTLPNEYVFTDNSLTTLPAGWTAGNVSTAINALGLEITRTGATTWGENYVQSQAFTFGDGEIIEIDFVGTVNNAGVGLADTKANGGWGDFNGIDSLMWLGTSGNMHRGNNPPPELRSANYSTGADYRLKFERSGANLFITYMALQGGTYLEFDAKTTSMPTNMLTDPTTVLLDAGFATSIVIKRVAFGTPTPI